MKNKYIVAENAFTITAPDALAAWEEIDFHFRPFLSDSPLPPVLEVEIRVGELPRAEGEKIYKPTADNVGFVEGVAYRLSDGSFLMEFKHIEEPEPSLSLTMPASLDKAEIVMTHDDARNMPYFLSHALMVAFMLATCGNGTLMVHASTVLYQGKAYLFQGKSGTGKSTHARLWLENIPGAELLNDDHPVLRFAADGTAMAYGSPWSGKTHCYRNVSAPVGAFVRIVRSANNELRPLPPLRAYASLTASIFFIPIADEAARTLRHETIERLVGTIPCYEMHCRPDADAARTCSTTLL